MIRSKVVIQRIVSPDGKVTAEAKSVVITSSNIESTTDQSVTVKISSSNSSTSSFSSSSTSSSASTSEGHYSL